jgi:DNA-directed RNA polymerase specialized sigma subunit
MTTKRFAKSRKTGQITEYSYDTIASKPINSYFRNKMQEHRRRKGIPSIEHSQPLTEIEKTTAIQLHQDGKSQHYIAKHLGTTRYRIQCILGLR